MCKRAKVAIPLVLTIALMSACSKSPYEIGKQEALQDLKLGKQIIKTYGMPTEEPDHFKETLMREYNIDLRAVAGCLVTDELIENVKGYNEVSRGAIEARYGKGFLESVHIQAFEEHSQEIEARYGKEFLEAVREQEYKLYEREKDTKEPMSK